MEGFFGLMSSTLSTSIVHPIDVIKTNYQVSRLNQPQNIMEVIKSTYQKGGVKSFYRGLGPNLGTYPIFWSVYFQAKKYKLDLFENKHANNVAVSFIAGNIASVISNPLFVIKTRLQTRNNPNMNFIKTSKNIYHNSGFNGFFKGLPSTLLNNMKLGIQFPMYDYLHGHTQNIAFSSATAKLVSSTILYPLDLIRINQRNTDTKLLMKDVVKNIYRREGLRGFYRGVLLYNCVSTPNFMIMMLSMELFNKYLS